VARSGDSELNKFAYYKGNVVGAMCSRLETVGEDEPHERIYIMTLATIAAYRGRGIGSQLLQSVLDFCENNPSVSEVALHVQISNSDAIRFYTERFGFVQGEMVHNYYRRINPPHCYVLYKKLHGNI
jgi:ribosomal protein S18 acetylase RimI-like enzyme